jgi:geranylgeranyl pyrophosphate synthase
LFSWATGAKGLIAGQFLDLKTEKQKTLDQIIRIHELKTARLIEIATIGSYLLSSNKVELKKIISFMKLGRNIGVSFQFLDDLCELTDSKTSTHEEVINPFLSNPEESFSALMNYISEIKKIISKFELVSTSEMLRSYFHSIHQTIKNAEDQILVHIGNKSQRINLNRLMASLETF